MEKLLKEYELATAAEYYDMCIDSYINEQRLQAKMQFNAMPTKDQLNMVRYIKDTQENNFSHAFFSDLYEFFFDII